MKTFIAVVEKDPDSAYGVRFPDVPGCFSAADDFNDVLPNAACALQLYFENAPVPEPRDLDVVRAEVAQEIAAGAALIAVPLVAPRASRRGSTSVSTRAPWPPSTPPPAAAG